jgi:hypothetical protein
MQGLEHWPFAWPQMGQVVGSGWGVRRFGNIGLRGGMVDGSGIADLASICEGAG